MTITMLVITDGRKACMERTMSSMYEMLDGPVSSVVIVDDSADETYAAWLDETYQQTTRVHHVIRQGFGGAIQAGWHQLGKMDVDWVFHLEDDFIFNRRVSLEDMVATLAGNPHLAQLVLCRQPWNEKEWAAGGIMQCHPLEYQEHVGPRGAWVEHRLFWSTNPSLYPARLMARGWPQGAQSEGRFGLKLLAEDAATRFAFWGCKDDPPWVEHIGAERAGTGY